MGIYKKLLNVCYYDIPAELKVLEESNLTDTVDYITLVDAQKELDALLMQMDSAGYTE